MEVGKVDGTGVDMQHAHDTALTANRDPEEQSRGPLSPGRAFLILLALLIIAFGILRLTNPADTPAPPAQSLPSATPQDEPSQPSQTLTRAEAISTFERLNALGLKAVQDRHPNLISSAFVGGSSLARRASRIIGELRVDNVIDKIQYKSQRIDVVELDARTTRIQETRLLFPCFLSEAGKDVTQDSSVVRQVVNWTLHFTRHQWKLDSAELIKDRTLKRRNASCP